MNRGLLEAAAGETDRAIDTLRGALSVQPATLTARRQLATIFLQRRQFAELEAEARALIQYAPSDAEAHNVLGVALASQRKYDEAKRSFAEAVKLDPRNDTARKNLAHLP